MAPSTIALKRLLTSTSLRLARPALLLRLPAAKSASRLFNTAASGSDGDDVDHRERQHNHRSEHYVVFRGARASFGGEAQAAAAAEAFQAGLEGGFRARFTEEGLHLRVEMPGLGRHHVTVDMDQNTLYISGEGDEYSAGGKKKKKKKMYTTVVSLPPDGLFKMDQIEMKGGFLELKLPYGKV